MLNVYWQCLMLAIGRNAAGAVYTNSVERYDCVKMSRRAKLWSRTTVQREVFVWHKNSLRLSTIRPFTTKNLTNVNKSTNSMRVSPLADREMSLCRYIPTVPTKPQRSFSWCHQLGNKAFLHTLHAVMNLGVWSVIFFWEWKYKERYFVLKIFELCNENLQQRNFPAARCTCNRLKHACCVTTVPLGNKEHILQRKKRPPPTTYETLMAESIQWKACTCCMQRMHPMPAHVGLAQRMSDAVLPDPSPVHLGDASTDQQLQILLHTNKKKTLRHTSR